MRNLRVVRPATARQPPCEVRLLEGVLLPGTELPHTPPTLTLMPGSLGEKRLLSA
jgi:hypothetical protein